MNHAMFSQVVRRLQPSLAFQDFGRAQRGQCLAKQLLRVKPAVTAVSQSNGEINSVALEVGKLDGRRNPQIDVGVLIIEARQPWHQPFRRERRRHADAQCPLAERDRAIAASPRQQVEAGLNIRQHPRCHPRQSNGALGSVEQFCAKTLFKRTYLLADGARRHVELFGRLAEAELAGDGLEGSQRAQGRQRLGHGGIY